MPANVLSDVYHIPALGLVPCRKMKVHGPNLLDLI